MYEFSIFHISSPNHRGTGQSELWPELDPVEHATLPRADPHQTQRDHGRDDAESGNDEHSRRETPKRGRGYVSG